MVKLFDFFSLCRPRFLIYSPVMYTMGVVIARFETHTMDLGSFFYGLLFVLNTHIMTHLYNEFYDFEADCCNRRPSPWTGGSRILVKGKLAPQTSLRSAYLSTCISLLLLLACPTLFCLSIGLCIVLLGWGYSAPPLKLEYRGMGELDVAVVLNLLVPLWGYVLQGGNFSSVNFLLFLLPIACIEYARMMVMNMPDRESDKISHKSTLIVRIGMEKAVKMYLSLMAIAYIGFLCFLNHIPNTILFCVLLSSPLGFWVANRLRRDWKFHEPFYFIPFWASTHNGLVASLYLLGLILSYPGKISFNNVELYPLYVYAVLSFCFFISSTKKQFNSTQATS